MPSKSVKQKKLSSLSFFSGCMGLDLGLEKAGIHPLLACDFDKDCRRTISTNRPDLPVIDDLNNYEADEIRKIAGLRQNQRPTLIVGGPPCQAFSTAGKRKAFTDPRGNVFLRYIQLIEDLQPDYAVIENVRGLLSAALKHRPHDERGEGFPPLNDDELPGGALYYVMNWLERIGYATSFNLYNAANYGVPQKRERVILIASRNGKRVPFIEPTHSGDPAFDLPPWITFREAVKGLRERDMDSLAFSKPALKYYEMLKAGQYWKHLPTEKLRREALGKSYHSGGGKTGFYRRLSWDQPSPTLVTSPVMPATHLAHPKKNRPLSIQEYKRIQQFPDDWILEGSLISQYKQVGNAVPLGLGEMLGKTLINHMNGIPIDKDRFKNFPYSRYRNTCDNSWISAFKKQRSANESRQSSLF